MEREPITRAGPFTGAYAVEFEMFALGDGGYIATGAIVRRGRESFQSEQELNCLSADRIGGRKPTRTIFFLESVTSYANQSR